MAQVAPPAASPTRRWVIGLVGVIIVALVAFVAWRASTPPATAVGATGAPTPLASPSEIPATLAPPSVAPATPVPTSALVPAPLTGLPVTEAAAEQHPIAVMIDDHLGARPQSGFNAAAQVWQAPAEGGIPRYMLIFQDMIPAGVGPVRSAREYYIEWAAEWHALYVHAGGSSQALATLAAKGHGQWVYNGEYFRYGGKAGYLWRVSTRVAPHNVYTDGKHLRALAVKIGADDGPITPAWSFVPDATPDARPSGGKITVVYPYETIQYRYDAATNTYLRYIKQTCCGSFRPEIDAADKTQVAPSNVVILRMHFGPLYAVDPHHRLEASDVGHGEAYISTNGITVKGTWSKASVTAPTLLFGPDGQPITLTEGQTFVQVIALNYPFKIADGTLPSAAPSAAASAVPTQVPSP